MLSPVMVNLLWSYPTNYVLCAYSFIFLPVDQAHCSIFCFNPWIHLLYKNELPFWFRAATTAAHRLAR